jgi:hypothetical protein
MVMFAYLWICRTRRQRKYRSIVFNPAYRHTEKFVCNAIVQLQPASREGKRHSTQSTYVVSGAVIFWDKSFQVETFSILNVGSTLAHSVDVIVRASPIPL